MNITDVVNLVGCFDYIVGIDEVGRGCIAGPLFVCSVIVSPSTKIDGVKDSKLLSPARREKLLPLIVRNVYDIGIGVASNNFIDRFGIGIALRIAMLESLANLKFLPKLIITDYVNITNKSFEKLLNTEQICDWIGESKLKKLLNIYSSLEKFGNTSFDEKKSCYISLKKADRYIHANSIASVVAKVLRDRYMKHISRKYPEYRFDKHKGYGTKEHLLLIKKYGLTDIHRKSFNITLSYDR